MCPHATFFLKACVKKSTYGYGVFAKERLDKGSVVCCYGPLLPVSIWQETRAGWKRYYVVQVGRRLIVPASGHRAIVRNTVGCIGALVNCPAPEAGQSSNVCMSVAPRGNTIVFKASRTIQAGEEVLWYYGRKYAASLKQTRELKARLTAARAASPNRIAYSAVCRKCWTAYKPKLAVRHHSACKGVVGTGGKRR